MWIPFPTGTAYKNPSNPSEKTRNNLPAVNHPERASHLTPRTLSTALELVWYFFSSNQLYLSRSARSREYPSLATRRDRLHPQWLAATTSYPAGNEDSASIPYPRCARCAFSGTYSALAIRLSTSGPTGAATQLYLSGPYAMCGLSSSTLPFPSGLYSLSAQTESEWTSASFPAHPPPSLLSCCLQDGKLKRVSCAGYIADWTKT